MKKTLAIYIDRDTDEEITVDITDMKPEVIKELIPLGVDCKFYTISKEGHLINGRELSPLLRAKIDAASRRLFKEIEDPNLALFSLEDLNHPFLPRNPRVLH